jgi:hypothetical protein
VQALLDCCATPLPGCGEEIAASGARGMQPAGSLGGMCYLEHCGTSALNSAGWTIPMRFAEHTTYLGLRARDGWTNIPKVKC